MPHPRRPQHRHFFALRPPPAEARRIAHAADRWFATTGTPVHRDRYHITLFAFPEHGEVPRGWEESLCEVGRTITAAPIAVTLDRLSGGHGPIVLRPSRRTAEWRALHRAIGDRVRAVGLRPRPDYRFQAHLTLGYRNGLALNEPIAPVAWRATDLVLIHSHVGLTRHDLVGRWPLTGAADPQLSLW
ncbi:2'-5' RNA ligase family protein [Hephaestia sp. GCM10023244]|uniref:2'-5' RNA ligase family protein n=1 Tax=unclassified Hephaestia TaxID=2631281 RepID=UPI00207759CF|nr:2'-5' RNA ligase family protein [Hephaestia sp. MAHUQ-44]MCM8731296.1 hypothetical protein [Hephaestia sp. MAHUQ-44]